MRIILIYIWLILKLDIINIYLVLFKHIRTMKKHFYTDDIIHICHNNHATIDDIFTELQIKFPDVGKSSVYRNISELIHQWKLKKIIWINNISYYEKFVEDHIHLIDEKTGVITDLKMWNFYFDKNIPSNFNINSMDIRIYWNFK